MDLKNRIEFNIVLCNSWQGEQVGYYNSFLLVAIQIFYANLGKVNQLYFENFCINAGSLV